MKFDLLCEDIIQNLIIEAFIIDISRKLILKKMIRDAMALKPAKERYEPLLEARKFLTDALRSRDYMNLRSRNITDQETIDKIVDVAANRLRVEDELYYKVSTEYLQNFNPPATKTNFSPRKFSL
jgi:hypothetical protein